MLKKSLFIKITALVIVSFVLFATIPFGIFNTTNYVNAEGERKVSVVVDGVILPSAKKAIVDGDKVLMPVDLVKQYIYSDIVFEKENARMYVNIEKPSFSLETPELNKKIIGGVKLNVITKRFDGVDYIIFNGMEKIFNIKSEYNEKYNYISITKIKNWTSEGTSEKVGITTNRLSVYNIKSFMAPKKLEILGLKKTVEVIEEDGIWIKVKTEKGNEGYVLKSGLNIYNKDLAGGPKLNEIREDYIPNGKINISWEYVAKNSPDLSDDETIEGLDVLAPMWFNIADSEGTVLNRGDINYVNEAHKKGYKVWGVITNSFSPGLTHDVLKSEELQEKVIKQMVVYTSLYNLDGINVDFENVYYKDKDRLTSFMEKLTAAMKEQNLMVSMAMTFPSSSEMWSKFYDREKLGKIIDYATIMAYDEHWAASPVSGSVASMPWVQRGLENTLKYIPKEKVIVGIPFYTRRWEETIDENGKVSVKSKAYSMKTANEIIGEKGLIPVWLEDIGQYYVEYNEDGKRYRIWIEDNNSIKLKANLVHKYNIAGAASWRKGYEEESVWQVLNDVLKKYDKLLVNNK